jgi:hypothetical protein
MSDGYFVDNTSINENGVYQHEHAYAHEFLNIAIIILFYCIIQT